MPLLKRKPVELVPDPDLGSLGEEVELFYLEKTGEVFTNYEEYADRLRYLYQRQFSCEFSGKMGLDYFSAQGSEKHESRVVSQRFPDQLKRRVLQSIQFQVMGRLDHLVDAIFDRYKDRYFAGEKVFVDLAGDKYFARVSKLFPPPAIRALAAEAKPNGSDASANGPAGPSSEADELASFAHKIGVDLSSSAETIAKDDNPDTYLYTVQLMDENHNFEGSFMEVSAKQLSRDRLTFSKSILKRYIRECVQREPLIAAPWVVKPAIAALFEISEEQTEEAEQRNKEIREGKLAKRRKVDQAGVPIPPKRRKIEAGERRVPGALLKLTRYPIEDLDLDPHTILDGRVLRRVNVALPPLPPKPAPKKDLLVPAALFDNFVVVWNMLNVFSKPLGLSTFSLDDFASALHHHTLEPRCLLLAEVHACLTNVIGSDTSRVYGTTGPTPIALGAASIIQAEESGTVTRSSSVAPAEGGNGDVDELMDTSGTAPAIEELAQEDENALTEEEKEFDQLIRKGITFSRRWDRSAKLKVADGREGWERHLIGCLCQRGGPVVLDNLYAILAHLFQGADLSMVGVPFGGTPAQNAAVKTDQSDPELAYLSLPLEDKLTCLKYLTTLALGSKVVRSFVDESELTLTDLRKQRADVNRDRKALIERRAELDGRVKKEEQTPVPDEVSADTTTAPTGDATPAVDATNGANTPAMMVPPSDAATSEVAASDGEDDKDEIKEGIQTDVVPANSNGNGVKEEEVEEDEEEDQLADDDDASEAGASESIAGSSVTGTYRSKALDRLALEGGMLRSLSAAKQRAEARLVKLSEREIKRAHADIEDALKQNAKTDDRVEREFRRYQNVARCRPLGKDRFHCRYWWFDGVGGMSLVGGVHGTTIQYGTGRLLVQGPSTEDWALLTAQYGGEEEMQKRRKFEEVDEAAILGVNEWAYFDDESELDRLQGWLNAKGNRELALKNAISKWRAYIIAGAKKRAQETAPGYVEDSAGRRSSRRGGEPLLDGYLGWRNKLAKI